MIEVIPDPIFVLLQMAPFLGVVFVLKFMLLDPLLAYLDERDARTVGVESQVSDLGKQTEEARKAYDDKNAVLRAELQEIRSEILAKAQSEEQDLLGEARNSAQVELQSLRDKVAAEVAQVKTELDLKAKDIGRDIASTVLGRPVA